MEYKIEKLNIPEPSAWETINHELSLDPQGESFRELATKHFIKKYEDCVFGAFEEFGYSREGVIRLGNEGRMYGIHAKAPGVLGCDEFYLDGNLLFTVGRAIGPIYRVDDGYSYNVSYHCKFAKGEEL